MTWIKENYEKFILLVVSLLLLVFSVLLILRGMAFQKTFAGLRQQVSGSTEVEPVNSSVIEGALAQIETPDRWKEFPDQTLFVSEPYILGPNGPVKPEGHGPQGIDFDWLEKYGFDPLDLTVPEQDPDGDGFSVLDEWNFKTDPTDKNSHPPYWSKLRLKEFIQRRFRLMFSAYTGNPNQPQTLTFQLNTLDLQQPTQFLKIGDQIAGTKFKIKGFEKKTVTTEMGLEKDISELQLAHVESGEGITLVLEKIVNSPDSYALFKYLWDGSEFAVKLNRTFSLKPDEQTVFKLVDIEKAEAVIENTGNGEKHKIPPLE